MSFRVFSLLGLALALAGPVRAETPPPIRTFDLPEIERLGVAIHRQDIAAWLATDALKERVPDLAGAGLRGWIVVDDGKTAKVRFLRDVGHGLEGGYDIDVTEKGAGPVVEPSDRRLTAEERTMFAARDTAMAALPDKLCRRGYNSAVVKDPDGEGWLVWMLAPSPAADAIPVGGHYRFTISADGRTVERRDALSASCLTLTKPKLPPKAKSEGLFVTHLVSPTPVETHVFLSLLYRQLIFVGTREDKFWAVDGGRVEPVTIGK